MSGGIAIAVLGTSTGVGKTFVSCGLLEAARAIGIPRVGIKPVETGCPQSSPASTEDGVRLAFAAGQDWPRSALTRLGAPLAPPVAAELEGMELEWDAWVGVLRDARNWAELLVIEGAGGVLSPVTYQHSALELARALSASVVLVAPNALGCLSAVLTALDSIDAAGVDCASIVLTGASPRDMSSTSNADVLRRLRPGIPVRAMRPRESAATLGARLLSALVETDSDDLG